MSCTFFVKNADISVALRDDLSFTFNDDLPEILLIDCQRRRGLVIELILFIASFSISRSMLRFQRCCPCCTVGCIECFFVLAFKLAS